MTIDICAKCNKPKYPFASTDARALGGICCCDKPGAYYTPKAVVDAACGSGAALAQTVVDIAKVLQGASTGPRAHKYGAVATECFQRHKHPSIKEANRCNELHLMEKAGEISKLSVQVCFPLSVNGKIIGRYISDFVYREGKEDVVEDCKSTPTMTPLYKWKKKHMKAEHGIDIKEI